MGTPAIVTTVKAASYQVGVWDTRPVPGVKLEESPPNDMAPAQHARPPRGCAGHLAGTLAAGGEREKGRE